MSLISGFKFNKNLGQNFILDEGLLESIIKELKLSADDTVVEIGTGAGTLTRVLARCVKCVVTYEIDKRLEAVLKTQFAEFANIELRFEDGLRAEIKEGRFVVVANIPYYITTPLLAKFMADSNCSQICVLVQDDVAKRIVAKPGGKEYGALSVALQAQADCRIIKKVPRGCFVPSPNVDSAFVVIDKSLRAQRINPYTATKNAGADWKDFEKFLKKVFAARRKTMLNALGTDKEIAKRILAEVGIGESSRPEQISVDKFIALSTKLSEIMRGS